MTKLIWFMVMLVVVAVSADDIKGVLPNGDDTKIENVDFPKEVKKVEEKLPHVKLTKNEPLVDSVVSEKVIDNELKPIMPIFPSFLQPKNFFSPFKNMMDTKEPNNDDQKPKRGVLTIILLNRKRPEKPKIEDEIKDTVNGVADKAQEIEHDFAHRAQEKMHSLTNFILNDIFGQKQPVEHMQMQPRKHLLGGNDDPDHSFFSIQHGAGYNENSDINDFIRYVKGDQMPVLSNDFGYASHHHHKNCNFLRYLKMKAHIHYRTIVHLIFVSGIILIILMLINFIVKSYKRRYVQHYYTQGNEDIASIDSVISKHKEAEANEVSSSPSILISAPPAYDEVNTRRPRSSLIKSLAAAYKSRYEKVDESSARHDEDAASVSSLPPYEAPAKSDEKK